MIDFGRDARLAADAEQFVEGLEQAISFAAHVRDVFAFVLGRDLAQFDQLICFGIESRRIDQGGADAECAGFHFLAHQLAHLFQLRRGGRLVFQADDILANGGGPDKRGHVAGNAAGLEVLQVFRQRVPLDLVFDIRLLFDPPLLHELVQRPHRFALAHDFRGHALPDLTLRTPILDE